MQTKYLILAPVFLILGACAFGAADKWDQNAGLLGARWELTGNLVVPAGKSMVFIQGGEVKHTRREGDKFEPYCNVQFAEPAKTRREITAGSFVVKRITYASDVISLNVVRYVTSMAVSSAEHPGVARITCQHWEASNAHYMSMAQMRQTMQGMFLLHSNTRSGSASGDGG